MFKKFLDLQTDILVLLGIYYALRFIITKELYIQSVFGNEVNTLYLLILTIGVVAINRAKAKEEETSEEIKSK
ncbi:hypothetical protein [Virgibacillus sp. 6R]|uniref:hypothetical protein n=1 Tax=Metabacillus sp. 22489 TaxID=3453928 RepID=UPI0011AA5A60